MNKYQTERKYYPSLETDRPKGKFSVIFEEVPEKLVSCIYRALGFKMDSIGRKYTHFLDKEKLQFAALMSDALAQGQLPEVIPYEPSFEKGLRSIDEYNFSIITLEYINQKGDTATEDFLIFERHADNCIGFGWLVGWIRHGQDTKVIPTYRKYKPRARSLLKDGKYEVALPVPFGTYNDQNKEVSSTQNIEFPNPTSNEEKISTVKPNVQPNGGKIERLKSNVQNNDRYVIDIKKDNDIKNERSKSNVQRNGRANDGSNGSLEIQKVNLTSKSSAKKSLPKNVFKRFEKLIPNILAELKRGVSYSESYSAISPTEKICFQLLSRPYPKAYVIDFYGYRKKEDKKNQFSTTILLNGKKQSLQVINDSNNQKTTTSKQHTKQSLNTLLYLIESLIQEKHLFYLKDEIVSKNYNDNKNAKNMEERINMRCIHFSISNKKKDKEVHSWSDANEYIIKALGAKKSLNLHFCISWNDNSLFRGDLKVDTHQQHPLLSTNYFGEKLLQNLLHTQYYMEGRLLKRSRLPEKTRLKKAKQIAEQIKRLDFDLDAEAIIAAKQAKIPLNHIKMNGMNNLSAGDRSGIYHHFKSVNKDLQWFVHTAEHEDQLTITVKWKDGRTVYTKLHAIQLPLSINAGFWEGLLKKEKIDHRRYQSGDGDALLLNGEFQLVQYPSSSLALKNSYWKETDQQNKQQKHQIKLGGREFHYKRLRNNLHEKLRQLDLSKQQRIFTHPTLIQWFDFKKQLVGQAQNNLSNSITKGIIQILADVKTGDEKAYQGLVRLMQQLSKYSPLAKKDKKLENETPEYKLKGKDRLAQNRKIESLIQKKGTESKAYSEEEKELLRNYTGYGNADIKNKQGQWQYAFFTPDDLVVKMWALAWKYGYKGGAVLEPSCGKGSFLKFAPISATVHAYENNTTSAKISQILYPKAEVFRGKFERHFDVKSKASPFAGKKDYELVIGNPPFGQLEKIGIAQTEKEISKASTYDQYFLSRGLDVLKEGGLLVFLMPSTFIINENKYNFFKAIQATRVDILDAYQLPESMFPYTEVNTDLLVLQKRKEVKYEE